MTVVDNENVKLEPLSRDDILRGIILLVSVFLIFFGITSKSLKRSNKKNKLNSCVDTPLNK